ncbi:MAG: methyltransferase domain-containing protein [Verrucomicrobia bacterium]|nr:MAG: methyltransferase domain-containing protein [Verrucomicrobiota bacterium]
MSAPWEVFKILADPTRLRIVALLAEEELSVAEMQEILDMGQSRISSQLALLRKAGLVTDRREGKKAYYSLNPRLGEQDRRVIEAAREAAANQPEILEDRENLEHILNKRRQVTEQYFNLIAGRLGRNYCPGRSWEAIGHMLLRLVPRITVADLGAGEGMISQLLARRAEKVWCIDSSTRMCEVGKELAKKNGLANLEYKLGDIEAVPLPDQSVDLALLSQALHHARHPQVAIREAYRILRPGGQIIVLDLKAHHFEKAREMYADLWLGFRESALGQMLREAGFQNIEVSTVARETVEPFFETILGTGVRR